MRRPRGAAETGPLTGHRIGVRLTATGAAAVVIAIALTSSGFLLVSLIHRSLVTNLDSTALARARDVATLASAGELGATIASAGEDSALVQVVGPSGQVVAASPNISGEAAALASPPTTRRVTTRTAGSLPIGGETERFRLVTQPVTLPSGPGWVYVAVSLSQVDRTVRLLITGLLLGLPVLLAVVTGAIWVAVGRALRPVEQMRQRAAAIGGDDLQQRVPVPRSRDEIARLAATLNEMLARLQASALRQQRFIGDASHELKSPLAALRAQVDVALSYPASDEPQHVLARVQQQTARMEQLIDDLLFLARSDERPDHRDDVRVDLDELVLAEARRLRDIGTAHVRVVGPSAAAVTGSARDLARALRNLGDNALAHARYEVVLGLRTEHGLALLTVDDDGPGIPEADRAAVFERFTRLEQDRSRHHHGGGSGLGLAICREIARAHRGEVTVGARPDGSPGAHFTMTIPLADPTGSGADRSEPDR